MLTTNCKPLPQFSLNDIERFWRYVNKREPEDCWPWVGTREAKSGYGRFSTVNHPNLIASRVAYVLQHGNDPYPYFVCHKCDNPPCCNGRHLFLGTAADNCRDAVRKGRHKGAPLGHPGLKGSANGYAMLTERQAQAVLLLYDGKRGCLSKIAKLFGVDPSTISCIVKGLTWPHLDRSVGVARSSIRKLTEDEVRTARRLYASGINQTQIALQLGCDRKNIGFIVHGKTWAHVD